MHAGSMQVGLQPDKACKPQEVQVFYWASGQQDDSVVQDDSCVALAKDALLKQPNSN